MWGPFYFKTIFSGNCITYTDVNRRLIFANPLAPWGGGKFTNLALVGIA